MAYDADVTLTTAERAEARDRADALVEEARRRFREAEEAELELRSRHREDLDFLDLDRQWPAEVKQERFADRRPCLAVDRLMPFVRQVLNQMRSVRPRIGVAPRDDQADPEVARVLEDLVRYIEDRSQALIAYQTAAFHQVTMGRGYLRVISEYADDQSFDQELRIVRVRNPFSVYLDPYATELDARDARYGFVISYLSRDAFAARFGAEALDRVVTFAPSDRSASSWVSDRGIQVAEYWYLDQVEDELWQLAPDPSLPPTALAQVSIPWQRPILKSALPRDPATGEPALPPGFRRVLMRKTARTVVRWAILSGTDLLVGDESGTQGEIWPTRALHRIPIVPVVGEEIDFGDHVDLRGIVRHAKDVQKLYNFHVSAMAEEIALKPKAPYIGYEGQFATHEAKWRHANRRSYPYLEVKPLTIEGTLAPLPQRQTAEPAVQAIVMGLRQADYDLKAVMGLYEPSLGDRRAGQSGRAILALQRQGEIGIGHYPDNLGTAMRAIGEILVDVIPSIYNEARVLRIRGDDRRSRVVMLAPGGAQAVAKPAWVDGVYDLAAGRYDVVVTVGPSQETRRQEVAAQLATFIQSYPAAFPVLGDLLVGSMDWDGADEAARRLKALIPPAVLQASDGTVPPELVAVQRQLQQLQEAAAPAVQQAADRASQERIEALRAATELRKAEIDAALRPERSVS